MNTKETHTKMVWRMKPGEQLVTTNGTILVNAGKDFIKLVIFCPKPLTQEGATNGHQTETGAAI